MCGFWSEMSKRKSESTAALEENFAEIASGKRI
jgi:hypothetical protein